MVRMVPRLGQEEHTLRAVRSLADSVRALPGCAAAEILREAAPPRAVVYTETWLDQEQLERHLVSPDFDLVLGLVESSAEPPSLEFRFVSDTRGLAWVEQLRLRRVCSSGGAPQVRGTGVVQLADRATLTKESGALGKKRKPPG